MYPSYYPHEIAIETIPPERAAPLLLENKIQAYLGPQPRFSGDVPVSIRAVESLGSFVIVLRNPAAPAPTDAASACAAVETVVGDIAGKQGFVFHPYPITPFHGDYLYYADLAEAAKARFRRARARTSRRPQILESRPTARCNVSFVPNGLHRVRNGMSRRGGRRGGPRRLIDDLGQRLARASVGEGRVVSCRAHPG